MVHPVVGLGRTLTTLCHHWICSPHWDRVDRPAVVILHHPLFTQAGLIQFKLTGSRQGTLREMPIKGRNSFLYLCKIAGGYTVLFQSCEPSIIYLKNKYIVKDVLVDKGSPQTKWLFLFTPAEGSRQLQKGPACWCRESAPNIGPFRRTAPQQPRSAGGGWPMNSDIMRVLGHEDSSSSYGCADMKMHLLSLSARLDLHLVQSGFMGKNWEQIMGRNCGLQL